MRGDGCDDVRKIGFDGFRWNAEQAVSFRFQFALPFRVVLALAVVNGPIHFNDEEMPLRAGINDEGTDDGLPPELRAEQLPIA